MFVHIYIQDKDHSTDC